MMRSLRNLTIAASLAAGLAGCAHPPGSQVAIDYNGAHYTTIDSFRAVYTAEFNGDVAVVTPMTDRVGGRLLVVLPDADRLQPIVLAQNKPNNNTLAAFVAYDMASQQSVADSIRRSNLFDSVEVSVRNDTEDPPATGYDYVLWMKVATTGANHTGQWYDRWMFKRGNAATAEPLAFDRGAPRNDRMPGFMRLIRTAAATVGGPMLASGGTPGVLRGALTGFAVNTAGDILTSDHGVASCSGMQIHLHGETLPATVVARDHLNDLALLHVGHSFPAPVTFRDGAGIRQADTVVAIGYPYGEKWDSNPTVTSGSVSALAGGGDDIRFLQFTAPIQPGNSGGPLLDPSGHVVGIVAAKLNRSPAVGDIPQNVNSAVKSAVIREFLDSNGIKYRAGASTAELHNADIAAQGKQAVVYVECLK